MDARVGDWVVTPRRGKPVEIQALWYNALRILAELEGRFGRAEKSAELGADAERARRRFVELFWNAAAGCLYDCVDQRDGAAAIEIDDRVRPNQVLALALPFELLDPARAASVLDVVEARLLTPVGLRSLDSGPSRLPPALPGWPGATRRVPITRGRSGRGCSGRSSPRWCACAATKAAARRGALLERAARSPR